ncbi:putative ATP-dependent DNA helicase DDX11 [Aphelenchoides besseyi]|nr:putative ATP-dependent DNA helicase DDX11 [Aphelenchoides besseyi]
MSNKSDGHVIPFPREPYEGQRRLATAIYKTCVSGTPAIFESPTGTGKSLAVLAGTLSYLAENSTSNKQKLAEQIRGLNNQHQETTKSQLLSKDEKFKRLHEIRCQLDEMEDRMFRLNQIEKCLTEDVEDALVVERRQFSKDRDENDAKVEERDPIEELGKDVKKLIYVSRTHSQLSQFLHEMNNPIHNRMRPVQIGSRASLCLNSAVNSLPNSLVNCECARLVGNSTDIEDLGDEPTPKKRSKRETCPYYKRSNILELRKKIWSGLLLNGSLKEEGERLGACPFYAAKSALPLSNVIAMPYNVLFDPITRETYGVDVKSNVVVVDEAHNFLNTVYDSASFHAKLAELEMAKEALELYLQNTKSTKETKLVSARQCIDGIERLDRTLKAKKPKTGETTILIKPEELRHEMRTTVDFLRLAKLIETEGLLHESRAILWRWWKEKQAGTITTTQSPGTSKLAALMAKVRQSKATENENSTIEKPKAVVVPEPKEKLQVDGCLLFGTLCRLFRALSTNQSDIFVYSPEDRLLRYLRLDIDRDLGRVIRDSQAFIMVGGTMRPKGYISQTIKTACSLPRVIEEQYSHVIRPSNLMPIVLAADTKNLPLTFKVSQLSDSVFEKYAATLIECIRHVPHGIVVFMPNYQVIARFEKLLNAKSPSKPIFAERRGADSDELMRKYTETALASRTGACLLASASGKLSEGINFSDNLARAVVMIGLPFPNAMEIETKLRATYAVEQKLCSTTYEYLSQTCTRVVAQCLGRAIRHANDFAALIFMDARYEPNGQFAKSLPTWMTGTLKTVRVDQLKSLLPEFYRPLMSEFK